MGEWRCGTSCWEWDSGTQFQQPRAGQEANQSGHQAASLGDCGLGGALGEKADGVEVCAV